ncbi:hypothetical protein [Clostridium thailandense]|uniref:hypothetical protein n=1 Tax=Clostridium thailandense TaxID=2794346 RepID=UPI0039895BC0
MEKIIKPNGSAEMLIFNKIQNTPKWSLGMDTSEKELYSQVKSLLGLIIIVMIIALIVLYIS